MSSEQPKGRMMPMNDARKRVRAVAQGATINDTYHKMPMAALLAFRADLLAILDAPACAEPKDQPND